MKVKVRAVASGTSRPMKDSGIEWVGTIPATWSINTVSQLFEQIKNKNTNLNEQNLLSLSYGKIIRKDIRAKDGLLPESFDSYNIIDVDDIVLRLTDLQNDHRSLRVGLSFERGIITSAYLTIRNKSGSLPKYLYYYLYSYDIAKGFYGMGGGVRQGLNWDGIKWLEILTPPISEQQRIVELLDKECARIDSVIEKTRESIEEYKKLKQSIITEAVTKGIRPNRRLKDSGIEWIGDIPFEWDALSFTKSIQSIVDYRGKTPKKQDEGTLLVTARNIKEGKIDYECSREFVRTEDYDEIMHRGKVEIGDVLFTTEAPLGAVANADRTDFALAQRIVKFQGTPDLLNNYYLKYWIMSNGFQQNLATFSTGSTAKGIKASKFCMLKQVLPPIHEQREIVNYLNEKTSILDELIGKKETLLAELESYKKSIIYEYVTGKKEVV